MCAQCGRGLVHPPHLPRFAYTEPVIITGLPEQSVSQHGSVYSQYVCRTSSDFC